MNQLIKTLLTASLAANDLLYVHWCVSGEDFDKSHELADDYYFKLRRELDFLGELAREKNIPIINLNDAAEYLAYQSEGKSSYNYDETLNACKSAISKYLTELETLRQEIVETDIQSSLDEIIRFWKNELDYKLVQRSNRPLPQGFISTGLDNRLAYKFSGIFFE